MDKSIQIVIPTYKRLNDLERTYNQLKYYDVIYVCHETDTKSQEWLRDKGIDPVIDLQPPSGVNATNAGYWEATADWVVIGQDDFVWHEGWLDEALSVQEETGAKVIGFNDGYDKRNFEHSVGWLVDREFVEDFSLAVGFPNVIFFPHYKKNFSDNELCDTARDRGVWAYAKNAILEHMHPSFNKADNHPTYTNLDAHLSVDRELYDSRKHLWGG